MNGPARDNLSRRRRGGLLSRRRRGGLTLIELMVAVTIIGILASILVGVAAVAGVTAREAQTKSMITRLHTLLIERFDGYRTRRVTLRNFSDNADFRVQLANLGGFFKVTDTAQFPLGDSRITAMTRVAGLRELMKLEMPDRWSDIYGEDLPDDIAASPINTVDPGVNAVGPASPLPNRFLAARPVLWSIYAREYNRIRLLTNSLSGAVNTRAELVENQGAELLYLTIINATGDGEARGLFREQDTGDTDGDGALEFLDGWGQPITLIRWPAGFESDLQLSFDDTVRFDDLDVVNAIRGRILEDHDPFDLFRVDNPSDPNNPNNNLDDFQIAEDHNGLRGWRLTPLIVSAGRDGEFGLVLDNGAGDLVVRVDPYANLDEQTRWLGSESDQETLADNIHNHALSGLTRTR